MHWSTSLFLLVFRKGSLLWFPVCFPFFASLSEMRSTLNPIALRKAKIVYNFGLSECSRVKRVTVSPTRANSFLYKMTPIDKGGKKGNRRIASPESDSIYL